MQQPNVVDTVRSMKITLSGPMVTQDADAQREIAFELVMIKGEQLGQQHDTNADEILQLASVHGLSPFPAEAALTLLCKLLHHPYLAVVKEAVKSRQNLYVVLHSPAGVFIHSLRYDVAGSGSVVVENIFDAAWSRVKYLPDALWCFIRQDRPQDTAEDTPSHDAPDDTVKPGIPPPPPRRSEMRVTVVSPGEFHRQDRGLKDIPWKHIAQHAFKVRIEPSKTCRELADNPVYVRGSGSRISDTDLAKLCKGACAIKDISEPVEVEVGAFCLPQHITTRQARAIRKQLKLGPICGHHQLALGIQHTLGFSSQHDYQKGFRLFVNLDTVMESRLSSGGHPLHTFVTKSGRIPYVFVTRFEAAPKAYADRCATDRHTDEVRFVKYVDQRGLHCHWTGEVTWFLGLKL